MSDHWAEEGISIEGFVRELNYALSFIKFIKQGGRGARLSAFRRT